MKIAKETHDRLIAGSKRFQPIVRKLAERDIIGMQGRRWGGGRKEQTDGL